MEGQTASAAELAALLGLSQRRVYDLARDGVIPKVGRRFPMPAATRAYCEHIRTMAAGRGGDADTLSEKRREAKERADKLALANAKARGDLVEASEVRTRWVALCTAARSRLMAIPSRLGARMGLKTADMRIVEIEIRQALEEMADGAGTDRG